MGSTMTGAYAGQFAMQGFLNLKIASWKRALITRSVALIPCLAVAMLFNSGKLGLDSLNGFLNILQSVVLPFAAVPLLLFVGSPLVMKDFAVTGLARIAGWTSIAGITA